MRTVLILVGVVFAAGAFASLQPAPVAAPPTVPPVERGPVSDLAGAKARPETPVDGVPLVGARIDPIRTPSAPHAWGGIREGQQTLSDRVVRYEIAARLDPKKHTVEGQQRLTWRNRSAVPIRSVYLHLYLNAFESAGSTFMRELGGKAFRGLTSTKIEKGHWGFIDLKKVQQQGRDVRWTFVHPDGGPDTDHTVARLDLPEPVAAGGTTTLDMSFLSQLPRVIARTGWYGSYHLVGQWFPKIGVLELPGERGATSPRWNCHEFHLNSEFYADFGSYDVKLTVPKGFTVGATGKLQGEPRETPEGLVHHYRQDDVHDFAWTAWDGYEKPLTAEWTFPGSPKVAVKVLYGKEYAPAAEPTLRGTLEALTYFSQTLGPYPYETVTAVVPPYGAEESGGMEYPTFFTSFGTRRYNPDLPLVDFVAIHEFGHGYFYGILASNEFEEPFLDEGLNELWNTRQMEASGRHYRPSLPWIGRLKHLPAITWSHIERLAGAPRTFPDPLVNAAWHRIGNYGHVYSGTAILFSDLERRLGKDVFARAFKEYYRRWKFRHPSTADLRAVLAEVSGDAKTIDAFFEDHVYGHKTVDDRIERLESRELGPDVGSSVKDGARTELDAVARRKLMDDARKAWAKANPGKKRSDKGPGPFPFQTTLIVRRYGAHVPQTVLVKFADGTEKREAWPPGEPWKKLVWVTPTKVVFAQLDPERKILADAVKLDDGKALERSRLASRRLTLEIGHWLKLALAMAGAL